MAVDLATSLLFRLLPAHLPTLPPFLACSCLFPDRACVELSKLTSLRVLNLSQNRALSDGGVRLLAAGLGPVLESFNLSYTSVTDESVMPLSTMKVGGGMCCDVQNLVVKQLWLNRKQLLEGLVYHMQRIGMNIPGQGCIGCMDVGDGVWASPGGLAACV